MNPAVLPLPFEASHPPTLLVLEAKSGQGRREHVDTWLEQARRRGARTWHLACDFDEDGPWAGLRQLLGELLPRLRRDAPELVTRHDYELLTVLPALRREMEVRHASLTDSSMGDERVRNYPMDRAFHVIHGLVEMLADWNERSGAAPWVIACEAFDRASTLVQRFFLELIRRRGQQLQLTLLLTVEPGASEALADVLAAGGTPPHIVRLPLPDEQPPRLQPEEARRRAEELAQRMGDDLIEQELHLPALIRLWEQAGQKDSLRRCRAIAFGLANHYGLYTDALRYGQKLLDELDVLEREDPETFWMAVGNLMNCYLASGKPSQALELASKMEAHLRDPAKLFRIHYVLAMLYGRFLPKTDLGRAEAYLEQSLTELEAAHLPAEQYHFHHVFNRNGLALIRHRQGRPWEAIELCLQGAARLEAHLAPDQHRLHRSVLQYNVAQVYAALGEPERAVAQYTAAIEMDPHYSEYHNERGRLLMRMGRLEEALADFQLAEELSPPYPEVRINLGQSLRLLGRMEEAFEAYGKALDLNPDWLLARIGRAQTAEELGRTDEALADYTAALELEPAQPLVLANRATLHYEEGRPDAALADLNAALALAPEVADLHRNRALVLTLLGHTAAAAEALRTYRRLAPEEEDGMTLEAGAV
ncbi:tetratricopeptide repeat protein [Archangium lipolyticum]|uniref:tetratricopeptide repeat protein n=1 Tax=Archangium lipolyticum TaxID=2970465 RepID=UPI002149BDE9|nr:tetratricopeptide repeat protein [Archangium lipolyticum]